MVLKIYTLGTSNRSIKEFLEILKSYQIQTVIDVRRWPTSKWFEHFKKENLEKILSENNIKYLHFEKLGGYRSGGYEDYTKTKEFKEALKELIKIVYPPQILKKFGRARNKNLAIICAEKLPWKCHRAYIARELERDPPATLPPKRAPKKFEIIHIIEKDRLWQPKKEPHQLKLRCQKHEKIF